VSLTEAGERFLPDARALLGQADALIEKARDYAQGAEHVLNIGITTALDAMAFPDLAALFRTRWPEVRLNLVPQRSIELIKRLQSGELDAALLGLPSRTGDLLVEHVYDDPLAVALPKGHPLARKRQLALADLQVETLFWFKRALNPTYHDHCQQVFQALAFSPRTIPEPTDHHVLLGMIAAGQGIALIPSSLKAIQRSGVVYRSLKEGAQLAIGIGVARRQGAVAPLVGELVESVRTYYKSLTG